MESVPVFPDTLKEHAANDLQDQIYKHKYALLMFLQFPDKECQRYVKMLKGTLESTISTVVKIDKMLLKYFQTLVDSTEKLLGSFHPFLLKVKPALCFSTMPWTSHVRSKLSEQNKSNFM